jgi:hypothetical protein
MARISLDQKVSTHLAFALVLVLSFLLSWYSLRAADEIVKSAPDSKTFNFEKRAEMKK